MECLRLLHELKACMSSINMQQRPACAGKFEPSTLSYSNESTIASTGPDRPTEGDQGRDWAEY